MLCIPRQIISGNAYQIYTCLILIEKVVTKYRSKYLKVPVNLVKGKRDSGVPEMRYMPTELILENIIPDACQESDGLILASSCRGAWEIIRIPRSGPRQ